MYEQKLRFNPTKTKKIIKLLVFLSLFSTIKKLTHINSSPKKKWLAQNQMCILALEHLKKLDFVFNEFV